MSHTCTRTCTCILMCVCARVCVCVCACVCTRWLRAAANRSEFEMSRALRAFLYTPDSAAFNSGIIGGPCGTSGRRTIYACVSAARIRPVRARTSELHANTGIKLTDPINQKPLDKRRRACTHTHRRPAKALTTVEPHCPSQAHCRSLKPSAPRWSGGRKRTMQPLNGCVGARRALLSTCWCADGREKMHCALTLCSQFCFPTSAPHLGSMPHATMPPKFQTLNSAMALAGAQ